MRLILASESGSRRAMLDAAGIAFETMPARIDEDGIKTAMAGRPPRDIADILAEMKAIKVSAANPVALVLGSDTIVALDNGTLLDKPTSREQAAEHLRRMSGTVHRLWSAAVIAELGRPVWRHVESARMTVRPLSDRFIDDYLDHEWPAIAGCVGCYRIEGPGIQLFAGIEGSHFTILGMPLLPVIDYLRVRGSATS
ncbi:Maf family protein [uncultured Sphingomonas sp.]|uniref:Maf family protein n=1 Tax=uncultured Sphingomonas sp. TaxID=158754 RepID=UPI0035C9AE1F